MSETFSRGSAVLWALSLGILTAFTVGSTITVSTPRQGMLVTGLWLVASSIVLYAVVVRHWDRWAREQPLVRIVVYFAPLFVGTVVLDAAVGLLVGRQGTVSTLLDGLVAAAVFAATLWLSFYRGAYRLKDELMSHTEFEW